MFKIISSVLTLIISIVLYSAVFSGYSVVNCDLTFPSEFLIGTASSAYQIEGAWNVSDKGESNWDYFLHNFLNTSTGDISTDFYHKYREDIKLLKDIGFNHFRFSISWPRIFPNGFAVNASESGIQFYHNILNELEMYNITPMVTIYHWDHPQALEKIGGWLNEEMAYIFSDYAKFIFKEFGSRVKIFTTINEPNTYCTLSYDYSILAPGVNLPIYGKYLCVQNMLKAHALAYHIYDKSFRKEQKGKIGIVSTCKYDYPKNEGDTTSSNIAFDFDCGWVMNPIFSKAGDYPMIMQDRIKERSILQGYSRSRFPTLTKQWVQLIRGSSDYFGLNYYTANLVEPLPSSKMLDWPDDSGLNYTYNSSWTSTDAHWLKVVPKSIGDVLRKIKEEYGNPPVFILENGVADSQQNDNFKINYLYAHMKEVLTAIKHDNCNVKTYTIWSFLDSIEWSSGYEFKFGLIQIDFNDKNRKRTPRKSALWVKSLLKSGKLIPPY